MSFEQLPIEMQERVAYRDSLTTSPLLQHMHSSGSATMSAFRNAPIDAKSAKSRSTAQSSVNVSKK